MKADKLLIDASELLAERGQGYDKGQERSMTAIVQAFNAVTGHELTTEQGWKFMAILKLVRSEGPTKADNYLDGAAYFALAGEQALKEQEYSKNEGYKVEPVCIPDWVSEALEITHIPDGVIKLHLNSNGLVWAEKQQQQYPTTQFFTLCKLEPLALGMKYLPETWQVVRINE